MSTTAVPDGAESTPTGAPTGQQHWLALAPEPVLAVLHTPPSAGRTRLAALLLPAFGWDNECSYRRRREWATQLAESGITAARFDFPGTESSAGSPLAPGRVDSWVSATTAAAHWLQEQSGCERLTAVGIGLGGLIAYQALVQEAPIDDLVLWGVRASGRAYVRELRAYAAVTAQNGGPEPDRPDGALSIGGHMMGPEVAAGLSSIDLAKLQLPQPGLHRVLLIGRNAHGVDPKLGAHLAESGADVTAIESDEYNELMSPPDLTLTPTNAIAASIEWMNAAAAEARGPIARSAASAPCQMADSVTFEQDGVAIRERLLELPTSAGRLLGVLSEPSTGPRSRDCLVVVNSGALRCTGPNRMFVDITRAAATRGVPAVRIDLPGLGDSDGIALKSFDRTADDDAPSVAILEEIFDLLEAAGIADRFVAGGFSLGGYLTVRSALLVGKLVGAISVNPTGFSWTVKQQNRAIRDFTAVAGRRALTQTSTSSQLPGALQKLAERLATLRRAAEAEGRRRLAHSDRLWRLEHRREIAGLSRGLTQLQRSDTRMLLLVSEGEPLLRMLDQPRIKAKLDRCANVEVEELPHDDHLLRPLWIQEMVVSRFVSALLDFTSSGARSATATATDVPG
jgi:pimeloyl-ACP methyl ester carboxylesterase